MTDASGLLRAIWDQPHDDLPRLVYADWLDEHGDADRAAFIRMQCEHARTEKYEDHWYNLASRIEKMWKKHKKAWQAELPESVRKFRFERGFVSPPQRDITAAKFMELTQEDLAAAPLWRYSITNQQKSLIDACRHINAMRLETLFFSTHLSQQRIDKLFATQRLGNIANMQLFDGEINDNTVFSLLDNQDAFANLKSLQFGITKIGDPGLAAIASSNLMSRIRRFDVFAKNCTIAGIESFFFSTNIANIESLDLTFTYKGDLKDNKNTLYITTLMNAKNCLRLIDISLSRLDSPETLDALMQNVPQFSIKKLRCDLPINKNGYDFLRIFQWPGLASIREIEFNMMVIDRTIAEAMIASPFLGHLRRIKFRSYFSPDRSIAPQIIRERFGNIDESISR